MFKIIEPHEHKYHRDLVKGFTNTLETQHPSLLTYLCPLKKATYFLAEDNPDRINGGAVFFKRDITCFHPQHKQWIDSIISPNQLLWTGTILPQLNEGLNGLSYEKSMRTFYQELYNSLIIYGVKEQISFLHLVLEQSEYLCTDFIGLWPYKAGISYHESSNKQFHGILPLVNTSNLNPALEQGSPRYTRFVA